MRWERRGEGGEDERGSGGEIKEGKSRRRILLISKSLGFILTVIDVIESEVTHVSGDITVATV